ncbi:MAG: hypothetical protein Q9225_005135 [Loekoesia sp. 1 TL-2023]
MTTSHTSTINPPYTATKATSVAGSDFSPAVSSSLLNYLGYIGCHTAQSASLHSTSHPEAANTTAGMIQSRGDPTLTGPRNTISTAGSIAYPSKPRLSAGAKDALGVSMAITAILICTLVVLGTKRYQKSKRDRLSNDQRVLESERDQRVLELEGDQPYSQQRGELEVEKKRTLELNAERRQYEGEGNNEIHEISATAETDEQKNLDRYELSGGEHCKELTAEEHPKELK